MTTELRPSKLEMRGDKLLVTWSDGQRREIRLGELRDKCPCATCREKRNAPPAPTASLGLPVLSMAEARPLTIASMKPVGNYAYSIGFSDGHDTGIFTLDFLRELGQTIPDKA